MSAANQNLMLNLSGLLEIYCVKGHRTLVGNNFSSIVKLSPGRYHAILFSINLFHISEIWANLSVSNCLECIDLTLNLINLIISQNLSQVIVSLKNWVSIFVTRVA